MFMLGIAVGASLTAYVVIAVGAYRLIVGRPDRDYVRWRVAVLSALWPPIVLKELVLRLARKMKGCP